jgi:hypothetical protein
LLSRPTTVEQIDAWRAAKSETEKLEFKEAKNQFDFNALLAYCVAIANERGGILLLGIANRHPRPVVGTKAFLNVVKTTENIFNKLRFRVDIEEVQHPDGRVLVFHIPSRPTGHPYQLEGSYYMRSGESLVAMTPDQIKQIVTEEGSGVRKAIVSIVVVLVLSVIGFLSFKYWDATHKPRQRDVEVAPTETHPTTDKPTAVIEHPEQQPNIGARGSKPKSTNIPTTGSVDWHDKHTWRKYLRVGMTREEVRRLFGEAEKIRVSENLETWDYGSGEIEFFDGALYSWSEPD